MRALCLEARGINASAGKKSTEEIRELVSQEKDKYTFYFNKAPGEEGLCVWCRVSR